MESGIKLPPPPPKRGIPIPPPPKKSARTTSKPPKSPTPANSPSPVVRKPARKAEIKAGIPPSISRQAKEPTPEVQTLSGTKSKPPAKKTAVPTKKIQEEAGSSILETLSSYWNGTTTQVQTLSNLTYPHGDLIIDPNRRDVLLEIIGMLMADGYDQTLAFLRAAPNPDFILWEQPSMEEGHNALARELDLQQTEEKGIKGIGKCRFCPSTELIVKQVQTRSGDEAMTVFIRCVMCQKQWRT